MVIRASNVRRQSEPPTRERSSRSKWDAILKVAADHFGHSGYEMTKWADIAEQVGIGQSALYHYFESKAHCLLTIIDDELHRARSRFIAVTETESDPERALRAVLEDSFDVTPDQIARLRVVTANFPILSWPRNSDREEQTRKQARAAVHDIEQLWIDLLQAGMKTGVFVESDARLTTLGILGLYRSTWLWYVPSGPLTLKQLRSFYIDSSLRVVLR